jgi:hypothetical protein
MRGLPQRWLNDVIATKDEAPVCSREEPFPGRTGIFAHTASVHLSAGCLLC